MRTTMYHSGGQIASVQTTITDVTVKSNPKTGMRRLTVHYQGGSRREIDLKAYEASTLAKLLQSDCTRDEWQDVGSVMCTD